MDVYPRWQFLMFLERTLNTVSSPSLQKVTLIYESKMHILDIADNDDEEHNNTARRVMPDAWAALDTLLTSEKFKNSILEVIIPGPLTDETSDQVPEGFSSHTEAIRNHFPFCYAKARKMVVKYLPKRTETFLNVLEYDWKYEDVISAYY